MSTKPNGKGGYTASMNYNGGSAERDADTRKKAKQLVLAEFA